jgi:hypothetical protein
MLLRLLLLGPRVLLLGLPAPATVSARESMCMPPSCMGEREGAQRAYSCVDQGAYAALWGAMPGGAGRLVLRSSHAGPL